MAILLAGHYTLRSCATWLKIRRRCGVTQPCSLPAGYDEAWQLYSDRINPVRDARLITTESACIAWRFVSATTTANSRKLTRAPRVNGKIQREHSQAVSAVIIGLAGNFFPRTKESARTSIKRFEKKPRHSFNEF